MMCVLIPVLVRGHQIQIGVSFILQVLPQLRINKTFFTSGDNLLFFAWCLIARKIQQFTLTGDAGLTACISEAVFKLITL